MLKIENLSVAVQGRQILHDINLHVYGWLINQ